MIYTYMYMYMYMFIERDIEREVATGSWPQEAYVPITVTYFNAHEFISKTYHCGYINKSEGIHCVIIIVHVVFSGTVRGGVTEGGDSTLPWEVQCLSVMALWHPDHHASATSPPLLREDEYLRNNCVRDGQKKHNRNHNFPQKSCIGCRITTALDGTSDENSLCFLCVPLCRRVFGAASGGTPQMKHGAPRDELKNGRGRGWVFPHICWSEHFQNSSSGKKISLPRREFKLGRMASSWTAYLDFFPELRRSVGRSQSPCSPWTMSFLAALGHLANIGQVLEIGQGHALSVATWT